MEKTEKTDAELQQLMRAYKNRDLEMILRMAEEAAPSAVCAVSDEAAEKSGISGKGYFLSALFYLCLVLALFMAFNYKTKDGIIQFFGYSYFTVLTDSMRSELPRGTLVVVKQRAASEIAIGDDITFFTDKEVSVTHRVIDIIEDCDGAGNRGFRTKGIENQLADQEVVHEGNVVGVVEVSVPGLGGFLSYVRNHTFGGFVILGIVILLSISVRILL